MRLRRLVPEAQFLVTQDLASGVLPFHPDESYAAYLEEAGQALDLRVLDQAADDLIKAIPRHAAGFDEAAAPLIHRALPLTRREAAQPGIWRFLAVAHRPDLVRHRWEVRSWDTTRTRYWSPGVRHDSNLFSRLWWIAELTRDGTDYTLTQRVFSLQAYAIQIFVRSYAEHRPAVVALVEELEDDPSEVEWMTKELLASLATVVVEAMDVAELRGLIRELKVARPR